MQYFEPPTIDRSIFQKAGINKTILVPIKPFRGAFPQNCLNNVRAYIDNFGGEVQLGWIFSIMGNIALKLTAHAVVKTEERKFFCVTPNPYRKYRIRFSPDNAVKALILNDFLPQKLVPLVTDKILDNYLVLEREMNALRLVHSGLVSKQKVLDVEIKAQVLYPSILQLARENTSRKDYCFCGSNRKRAKCCP